VNIKNILFIVGGAFVGWKVGERAMPGTVGEIGGGVVGAAVGYWVGKKV
jgi:hypothetical protein